MKLPFPSIPAHIRWPGFVVALLLISITASFYTLYKAQTDGGAAIVKDYYEKGKQWDDTAKAIRNGDELTVSVRVMPASSDGEMRPVEISVQDQSGTAVSDLNGMIRALRPHLSAPVAAVPLHPVADSPGTYRQLLPIASDGVWDFEIDGSRGDTPIQTTVRTRL
ncbi:hypothetical protein CRI94_09750 [Longibacter salinarum]|uniref:Nitrogen fixation protein FixH n=1 Tax=Longibacter salinarum TaxID=1850348 RepID=A0A2A8CY92_9BACT|nr:FixH family protein [Longibacter salinarum]PEN13581.1 hypothetical protein CRI94_09750 [Longibacter salinarum]